MRAKHGKTNKLALRVLSTAALMTMVTSIAAPAFADAYGIDVYGIYNVGYGSVTVVGNKVTYTDENKVTQTVEDNDEEGIIITGKTNENNVTLKDTTVTIRDLEIDVSDKDKAALETKKDVTIELDGDNKLISGEGHAGLEKNNIVAPEDNSGTLTIQDNNSNGTLFAKGGDGGAGIGGCHTPYNNGNTYDITVKGGTITAEGGNGAAGIGGGRGQSKYSPSGGNGGSASGITISGSNTQVTAIGSEGGAGIGGGCGDEGYRSGQGYDITIKDGAHVEATGGEGAAGIGGGDGSKGGPESSACGLGKSIMITGDGTTVNAIGGAGGAGIGGGTASKGERSGQGYVITVSDGAHVEATGTGGGAGIGGGNASEDGGLYAGAGHTISISGEGTNVKATGSEGAAGIGGGKGSDNADNLTGFGKDLTVSDGAHVEATGGAGGAGIGGGEHGCVKNASVSGGNVTANGGTGAAGIGSGADCIEIGSNISISGGNVTANGGNGAAGIGDGANNKATGSSTITITGGTIKANGGKGDAAGIGNGENDSVDANVTINANDNALDVTATTCGYVNAITGEKDLTMEKLGNEHSGVVRSKRKSWLFTYLYNTVHNGKYVGMADNNADDHLVTDAHIWGSTEVIKSATPAEKGILRHHCAVEGCKGYYDEEFDYVEPDDPTPVTPVKPDPKPGPDQPGETPETPNLDTTAPGGTADVVETPAAGGSAEVTPAGAVTGTGKAEAAAPAQSTKAPAQNAAALPQTGVNWLAALGSALSGFALMAVGFFLNRKRGGEQH